MDAQTLDRFRKILGLLGSDHDGERAVAALKATAMLKASGATWGDVGIGRQSSTAQSNDQVQIQYWMRESTRWQMLLEDERKRSRRLSQEIDDLKRRLDKVERNRQGELHEALPPKPVSKKAARRRRRIERQEAEKRAEKVGPETIEEKALREQVRQTLSSYDAGELNLSERTEEFLRSVDRQGRWTDRQREAVERTMQWVWKQ